MTDVNETYCGDRCKTYVNQTIKLYPLSVYSDEYQLFLNKTGKKSSDFPISCRRLLRWQRQTTSSCQSAWGLLCLTLWDSMDCSPPGSSAHGNFQARILEWVAVSSSRDSSQGSYLRLRCLLHWQVDSLPRRHLGSPSWQIREKLNETCAWRWRNWVGVSALSYIRWTIYGSNTYLSLLFFPSGDLFIESFIPQLLIKYVLCAQRWCRDQGDHKEQDGLTLEAHTLRQHSLIELSRMMELISISTVQYCSH